jgi:hypothetical protein
MIDITKPVMTRDGTPVEIISDKLRDAFSLLGYIGTSRELDKWTPDGSYYGPNSTSSLDLVNYEPQPKQPDADSWIPHIPGDPMPCDGDLVVSVKLRNGEIRPKPLKAKEWVWEAWGELARSPAEIIAWRPHKRPLPQPQPEEWAEEKAAFAAGKVIQHRFTDSLIFDNWLDCDIPSWYSRSECSEYRIKPEPQWVPLGPEDVPPGSVIRRLGDSGWCVVIAVGQSGISVTFGDAVSFEVAMKLGWQIKRPSEDWKPCKKEAAQ